MTSNQPYIYKNPVYLKPIIHPVKYQDFPQQNYQINEINLVSPVEYETNQTTTFSEYEMVNQNNPNNNMNYFIQDYSSNLNNQYLTFNEGNKIDTIDIINQYNLMKVNNQYNIEDNNNTDYTNQINAYNQYNQAEIINTQNYTNQYNAYSPIEEEDQINYYYSSNTNNENNANNIIYQSNEINNNLKSQTNINENNSKIINQKSGINKNSQEQSISADFSLANDKSGANKINKVYTGESSEKNVLISIKTVKSIKHQDSNDNNEYKQINEKEQENIDSPRLVTPLFHEEPPSPILISKQFVQKKNSEEIILFNKEIRNIFPKKKRRKYFPK